MSSMKLCGLTEATQIYQPQPLKTVEGGRGFLSGEHGETIVQLVIPCSFLMSISGQILPNCRVAHKMCSLDCQAALATYSTTQLVW